MADYPTRRFVQECHLRVVWQGLARYCCLAMRGSTRAFSQNFCDFHSSAPLRGGRCEVYNHPTSGGQLCCEVLSPDQNL